VKSMSGGMKNYAGEAARCTGIKNEATEEILRPDQYTPEQWINLYSFARNHPQGVSIIMNGQAIKDPENTFSESELKAMPLPKLAQIVETKGGSPDGGKDKIINRILMLQQGVVTQ
jgi:hypothetical protein